MDFPKPPGAAADGVVEEEIKLTAATKKILSDIKLDPKLDPLAENRWQTRSILTVYLDTSNRYLLSKRLALRLRSFDSSRHVLGLKGFGRMVRGVANRLEWEQPLTDPGDSFYSGLHYSDIGAGSVKDQIDGLTDGATLRKLFFTPLLVTDIKRQTRILQLDDGCRMELALDYGTISAAGSSTVVCEVELEKISGSSDSLRVFADALALRHNLFAAQQSKFAMGLTLAGVDISLSV